jgi:hypothetical protein
MTWRRKSYTVLALALSACATPARMHNEAQKPRWELPNGRIAFRPICGTYGAPLLGDVPTEGLTPVYLFGVNGASADEINRMAQALHHNGFATSNGYAAINGMWILFAAGQGVVKTQAMADRLFGMMCALQFEHVQLVHARYNLASEKSRMT